MQTSEKNRDGIVWQKKSEEDAEFGLSQAEKDLIEAIDRCRASEPAPKEEKDAKEEKPSNVASSFFGQTGIFSKAIDGIKDGGGNVFGQTDARRQMQPLRVRNPIK